MSWRYGTAVKGTATLDSRTSVSLLSICACLILSCNKQDTENIPIFFHADTQYKTLESGYIPN